MAETRWKSPAKVAESLSEVICVKKVTEDWWRIAILGFLAGAFIGFGGQLANMISLGVGARMGLGFAKFLVGSVFSVGLMLVVIAGAELFTGNNLMLISVFEGRTTIGQVLEKWALVFVTNFLGAFFIAYLMYVSGLWKTGADAWGITAVKIAAAKVNLGWLEAFSRAILCNWLVCLAVWMAIASNDIISKIFAIYFPIMAFVASGFEHIIANFYFIPMGLLIKGHIVTEGIKGIANLNISNMLIKNFIPVTIGNIIGGAFFVATLYFWVYLKEDAEDRANAAKAADAAAEETKER